MVKVLVGVLARRLEKFAEDRILTEVLQWDEGEDGVE